MELRGRRRPRGCGVKNSPQKPASARPGARGSNRDVRYRRRPKRWIDWRGRYRCRAPSATICSNWPGVRTPIFGPIRIFRRLARSCQRRFATPLTVSTACGTPVAGTRRPARLFRGWLDGDNQRNLLRFVFLKSSARKLIPRWENRARHILAEFRADYPRNFRDGRVRSFIECFAARVRCSKPPGMSTMFGIARAGYASSIIRTKAGAPSFSTHSFPRSGRTTNSCCWCLRQALRIALRRNETAILRRRGSRVLRHQRAIARCAASLAMASIAARSAGKSAAIQAASAARMAAPSGGPAAMPMLMKSAALSGKTGAGQRSGRVASSCQAVIGRARLRSGPSHQHAINKGLRTELIKQCTRGPRIRLRRNTPPAFQRQEPFGFGVG